MEYNLRRVRSRKISLRVEPDGKILVKAPVGMPLKDIDDFVNSNSKFISERLSQVVKDPRYYVKPEDYPACREQLLREITPRVEYYSHLMGLQYSGITISSAKKRFGSCTSGKQLRFSLFLLFYPPELRDLVVVHELAHIREMNHSPAFYAILDRYMPDHRRRSEKLMNYFSEN